MLADSNAHDFMFQDSFAVDGDDPSRRATVIVKQGREVIFFVILYDWCLLDMAQLFQPCKGKPSNFQCQAHNAFSSMPTCCPALGNNFDALPQYGR